MKDLNGNWQAQNFDTGAAESVLPRRYAESLKQWSGEQSAGRAVRPIAATTSLSGSRSEHNTDMDVVPGTGNPAEFAAEGRDEDDEFQRPKSVGFHDEQMYPIRKEGREEHELLGHVQYR